MMNWSLISFLFISFAKAEFIDQLQLLPIRKFSGGFSKTVHYSESAISIKPLCFNYQRWKSLPTDLISHKLCEKQGFPTFVKSELVNLRSFSVNGDAAIPWGPQTNISSDALIFNRSESDKSSCTHFWQVDCGSCYFSFTLSDTNALATTIRSPLYPYLPDNIICQYEITSNSKMDLVIENVDLQPSVTVYSMGRKSEVCLNSFLQIQPLLPPGIAGDQGALTVHTLCGQHRNVTVPVNGKQVRLMLVTGDNNGKLFTGFRIRVLFVQTGLKRGVEMIVIAIGISIPLFCFFIIFFSHKLSCKKWSKTRNRRYLNNMTQQQRRHYRHSTWMGDLPRNGETIHETRTRRLQRLLESEENNYIMDNRITRPSPPSSQRPLPEIPEENYTEQVYSITGGELNNNLYVSFEQLSNSSRIYQSLQPIRAKETPVYLELLSSGDRRTADGRKVSGSVDLSPIPSVYPDVTGKKKEKDDYLAHRGLRSSSRNISEADAKLADETPIRFFSSGLAVLSRRFSALSSRVATMASYSSIKRKETNNLEESVYLLEGKENLNDSGKEGVESLTDRQKSSSKENNQEKEDSDDDVFDNSNLV